MHAVATATNDAPADPGFPSPQMPHRVMVRGYRTLGAGMRAIERLRTEVGIPRDHVTLVARDPHWVDDRDLGGRLRLGSRAGALLGALCGLVLYVLGIVQDDVTVLLPVMVGAIVGAIASAAYVLVAGAGRGGQLRISHYDVLVDDEDAAVARETLTA
jgi:hypothetical protein